ncbi:4Fe-4S dicluster domain-containing protein [Candidatus Cloacimonadota bacterium]
MQKTFKKGVMLNKVNDLNGSMMDLLKSAAAKGVFDAVMLPMQVPSGDSYTWMMIKDQKYLDDAVALSPIMPVNAAKALKRYTRKGKGTLKLAALIRPCEVRATIELVKLNQINVDDLLLISYDCAGALPMQDYITDPENGEAVFGEILKKGIWDSKDVKPVCQICDKFSLPASDLHFGIKGNELILIANSEKGEQFMAEMDLKPDTELTIWKEQMEQIRNVKASNKNKTFEVIKPMVDGLDNLLDTFANCIGCHNCQSACPICYCRQCYFDNVISKPNSDIVLMRAEQRGAISLPLDRMMFHTGRMTHMSLSCVSCGLCSDACPVNIPVAKIFSYVGSQTQATFEYEAGASAGDALPMKEYKPEELGELGDLVNSAEAHGGDHE